MKSAAKKCMGTDHLEEGEVSIEDVVEVDLRVVPGVVEVVERLALVARRDDVVRDGEAVRIDAVLEPAAEQVDSHDAEDEPEDQADQQHVEDGRDRLDQRVHHHLHRRQSDCQHRRFHQYSECLQVFSQTRPHNLRALHSEKHVLLVHLDTIPASLAIATPVEGALLNSEMQNRKDIKGHDLD